MTNVVIGSGPVGRIMALSLFQSGSETLLIGPTPKPCNSMAFAIHPKYFQFLQSLNICPPHQAIHSLTLDFQTPQTFTRKSPLSYIIRYNDLLSEIAKQLHAIPQILDKPTNIQQQQLTIKDKTIPFDNLIACDGKDSWIRQQLNIETQEHPYEQYAHTAIITHLEPQEGMSQIFRHFGTLGKLTLPNPYQSAIVWSVDHTTHQTILDNGLKATLEKFNLIENPLLIEHHQYIPLSAQHSKKYHQGKIFLAGNALSTIHPLLGIGFNLTLGDIQTLTDIICLKHPAHYYPAKRKRAHTKAFWLSHSIALSRDYDDYYPLINTFNQYSLGLRTIQEIMLTQLDTAC